ncbi:MAG: transcription termination factor NusA [Vulcanimicrobiota bacterium]
MNGDLIQALKQIEKERNIPLEMLVEGVESALTSAYRKNFKTGNNIRVKIDIEAGGGIRVIGTKTIVSRRKDTEKEISLSQTKKMFKKGEILAVYTPPEEEIEEETDDEDQRPELFLQPLQKPTENMLDYGYRVDVLIEENPKNFGRIAAQTTKQVIKQKIREAERDIIYLEYSKRIGEVISITVQRYEGHNWVCDLGKIEGVIPPPEQVPSEHFRRGERVKVYVLRVDKAPRGPQVIFSRTHPGLIRKLFEMEVPEIKQGLIEIHNVAREPGARSKVSVRALEPNVDPLGACVGPRGSRVQMVVDELRGEKIDIINYTSDPFTFVSNALSPAKVLMVTLNPEDRTALVIVPDDQFSLAIGKEGQNARLAAKLTNWKIDIKSETQAREMEQQRAIEEEQRIKEEKERIVSREEEQKKLEDDLRQKMDEEQKRREEEEKKRKEEEEQLRLEEEQLRKEEEEELRQLEEEERKRQEEEELKRLREYEPQFEGSEELELLEAPQKDKKKQKEIDEALKNIPKDMPIDQYVAMAYGEGDIYGNAYYPDEEERPKKKKKKKKKKREREFRR